MSATTRPPRPGERDGVDYHFWTPEQFQEEIEAGGFLEWAEVHGQLLRHPAERGGRLTGARGIGVILDIDVQGAAQVRRECPDALSIFLRASVAARSTRSGCATRHTRTRRPSPAAWPPPARELERAGEYDHQVINDDLDTAVAELRDLIARRFEKGTTCWTS